MKHVLKGTDIFIAPFALHMFKEQFDRNDNAARRKSTARKFHALYPGTSKKLIADLLQDKLVTEIKGDDLIVTVDDGINETKTHFQAINKDTKKEGEGISKQQQQQIVERMIESKLQMAHYKEVTELAAKMNAPIIEIVDDPKRVLSVDVLIDTLTMVWKHHVGSMLMSYGNDPNFIQHVANAMGTLTAFTIGADRGDLNQGVSDGDTNKQEKK
jgi:hypothetical protein